MDTELEKLRAVLNAIPGYVSWIGSNLRYLGVNETLASAYKMKPDEFIGKEIGFVGKASGGFLMLIQDFFKTETTHVNKVIPIKFATQPNELWYSLSMTKYDNNQKVVVVGIDVNELKKAQLVIEEQRIQIASSSKMSALGEMAASVTHELSSPLTVIAGYADYLKSIITLPTTDLNEVETIIDKVIKAATHASSTIDGFRRFSRDGSRDPFEMSSISKIIDNTLILCREKFKIRQVELRINLFDQNLAIPCQSTQIVQVLLNLINNALDALEEHVDEEKKWVSIDVKDCKDTVEIRVINSGPTIPVGIREKIMNPFFTTKVTGKGTGIGLTISRRIMDAHQGSLNLEDTNQTSFIAVIPKLRTHSSAAG